MPPKPSPSQQTTIHDLELQRAHLVANFPYRTSRTSTTLNSTPSTKPTGPSPFARSSNLPPIYTTPSVAAHSRPLPAQRTEQHEVNEVDLDAEAAPALKKANEVLQKHIKLLTAYNEVKDVAQGLMGMIAERRGVRVRDVMEGLGVGDE